MMKPNIVKTEASDARFAVVSHSITKICLKNTNPSPAAPVNWYVLKGGSVKDVWQAAKNLKVQRKTLVLVHCFQNSVRTISKKEIENLIEEVRAENQKQKQNQNQKIFALCECDFPPRLGNFQERIKKINRLVEDFNKSQGLTACKIWKTHITFYGSQVMEDRSVWAEDGYHIKDLAANKYCNHLRSWFKYNSEVG